MLKLSAVVLCAGLTLPVLGQTTMTPSFSPQEMGAMNLCKLAAQTRWPDLPGFDPHSWTRPRNAYEERRVVFVVSCATRSINAIRGRATAYIPQPRHCYDVNPPRLVYPGDDTCP